MKPKSRSGPRLPRKLDAGELWGYAVRCLSVRALTGGEVRQRLARRAANAADVEPALARLKDAGFLDDKRFAESFAASRLENQGLGKQRVLRDLRNRRVAPGLAETAVTGAYAAADEIALIEQYLARKFRNKNLPQLLQTPAGLASAYRKLRYAGFSSGNGIRVLKRYSEMADQLESEEETLENERKNE